VTFSSLNTEVSRLHLLVVCQLCAGAVHDHFATFQYISPLHQRQRTADILFDQQDSVHSRRIYASHP
jgi:hypothetical protein